MSHLTNKAMEIFYSNILAVSVDGSQAAQIPAVLFFIFTMFLPLALGIFVLSKIADILPFLRRFLPFI